MLYIPKYFKLHELVSKNIYNRYNEKAWEFLDPRALQMLDAVRIRFGEIVVNNWKHGRDRQYSGYREKDCKIGADNSQHRHGRAFDCISYTVKASDMREYILSHQDEFPYITCIEDGVSWLHFDCRNCEPVKLICSRF